MHLHSIMLDRFPIIGQFLRFGMVGTAGFVVDSAVLLAMLALGAGPYWGRMVSYVAAASLTFALNRAWTFGQTAGTPRAWEPDPPMKHSQSTPWARQWGLFLALNLLGFAANYGTYAALVAGTALVARQPVLGVAAGSIAGMLINFIVSRRYVFRPA